MATLHMRGYQAFGGFMHRITLSLLLCLCFAQAAQASPILFGAYAFDAPRETIAAMPGVSSGQGDMAQDLIRMGESYAGLSWTAQLQFIDDKLHTVTLLAPYDRPRFDAVRAHLEKNGFEVLGIVVDNKALDLFALVKAEGMDAFRQRFSEFLRAKTPERVSFIWFDTKTVSQDQKKMAKSMGEFLRMVAVDIPQVEVTQMGEAGSTSPQALLVTFSYPVLKVAQAREAKKSGIPALK